MLIFVLLGGVALGVLLGVVIMSLLFLTKREEVSSAFHSPFGPRAKPINPVAGGRLKVNPATSWYLLYPYFRRPRLMASLKQKVS